MDKLKYGGPVVLVVMDGVGIAPVGPGNAVARAHTPFLNMVAQRYLMTELQASGEAVGITPGLMGNSEVGHNAIGSGQIVKQGIERVNEAIKTGEIWLSRAWQELIKKFVQSSVLTGVDELPTLHLAGILSDGNTHSSIEHLEAIIRQAYRQGVKRLRVHAVLDGRDVPPQSEPKYIRRIEQLMRELKGVDYKIASGGGRMVVVADRYENDWEMVERGWRMMVQGQAEYKFRSAEQAVLELRRQEPTVQDQYLPAFVVVDEAGEPVGRMRSGDAMLYFDFRADRAIEIAQAFTYYDFPFFDRGEIMEIGGGQHHYSPGDIFFVGMTEYNDNTHVPEYRLVEPVEISDTLNQFVSNRGLSQLAVSETVKYGHITYYFDGNSYAQQRGEEYVEIKSDAGDYDTRPWMKAAEITDAVLERMGQFDFVRLNYPNGDMVGHYADIVAGTLAMEAVDLQLGRLAQQVDRLGGMMIITADHGCVEELLDAEGRPQTSHSTNLVPCMFYDNTVNRNSYKLSGVRGAGLANIASTVALLLGQNDYPATWQPPLIRL